ncbi:MAG: pyruvate kinase [Bryobacteraceae bacterium]
MTILPFRKTKIVATLGPATDSPESIAALFAAGVNVFRLNASHSTPDQQTERVRRVRAVALEAGVRAGILLDLQGPKIRLGTFPGGPVELQAGARFTITTEPCDGDAEKACTTYRSLAKDVKPGDRVLLNDGSVELRAIRTDGIAVDCEVVVGGTISDRKGINLPGVQVSTPALTRKDREDLLAGLEAGVDMVALSFVRSRDDLLRLRHFLEEHEAHLPVVAKIEKPEGWAALDEILNEADGVMVARGDLGVEMALEKVPFIQKSIIRRARARGRFVITATQMLESMIDHSTPTRAEVSDIANAIHDGTDAVMLSAETSTGRYPIEAVKVMARVACEAEATIPPERVPEPEAVIAEIITHAAWRASVLAGASALVVFTTSGGTARSIARYRPSMPVFAFTPLVSVARQLSVIYGVRAIEAPVLPSTDQMLRQMETMLIDLGWCNRGDVVVLVSGQPIGHEGATDMMKIHRLGESDS